MTPGPGASASPSGPQVWPPLPVLTTFIPSPRPGSPWGLDNPAVALPWLYRWDQVTFFDSQEDMRPRVIYPRVIDLQRSLCLVAPQPEQQCLRVPSPAGQKAVLGQVFLWVSGEGAPQLPTPACIRIMALVTPWIVFSPRGTGGQS